MSTSDYIGKTIDNRYHIISLIEKGGMGSVYLGRHKLIGRHVAIKLLHTQFVDKDEFVTRFYREARAAAEIGHKNIADVMDMGVSSQGEPYIVMEYLEGESLGNLLKRAGPIHLGATCAVLEPVLLALEAAHSKGIVHRDLKPENIFLVHQPLEAPLVKLIDFGVSKFQPTADLTTLTNTGSLLGTPAYMSPEQVKGASDIDHRADIYSIGVIMYQMLTGRLPFKGFYYHELLASVLTLDPIPPREAYEGFPVEVQPLIMQALDKDPGNRPQSAVEFLNHLRSLNDFDSRNEKIKAYYTNFMVKTVCSGDIGKTESGEKDRREFSSENDYVQMVRRDTPGQWANTVSPVPKRSKIFAIATILIGAFILMTVGFFNFHTTKQSDSVSTRRSESQQETEASATGKNSLMGSRNLTVQVEVRGAPKGAKIFYNQHEVPINPFRVKTGDTLVLLSVEAEGFETADTWVVPSEDRVVNVEMKNIEAKPQSEFEDEEMEDQKPSEEDTPKTTLDKINERKPEKKLNKSENRLDSSRSVSKEAKKKPLNKVKEKKYIQVKDGTKFSSSFE